MNRIGVVPKGHNTGKWRLIIDLSLPRGQSVNDGIDSLLCSLSYTTVEEVAAKVALLGKGTLLAKSPPTACSQFIPTIDPSNQSDGTATCTSTWYCHSGCGRRQNIQCSG